MPSRREEFGSSVQRGAEQVGQNWASQLRASIQLEHRRASGGWPGTLSEARTQVALFLLPWLQREGQGAVVTSEQREGVARLVYASARSAWLVERDAEDEG